MQEPKKFRVNLGTFDLVKGIAVIFMVMGHVLSYYNVNQMKVLAPVFLGMLFASNGLMPLFFLISGYGFQVKPAGTMLKKTARDLLRPYVWVMVFVAVLFPIIHYLNYGWWPGALQEAFRYLLGFLAGTARPGKILFGYSLYECTVVWFLLSMFWALNILNLILKIQNEAVQAALVLVCILGGWFFYSLDFIYYCIPQGFSAVGFCYLGHVFKKYRILERVKTSKKRYGVFLVLFLITLWRCRLSRFDLAYGQYEHFALDYVCAACTGILLLFLGAYSGQAEWKGLDWIRIIGIFSYWIICIHNVEQICIPWYRWGEMMAEHQVLGFLIEISIKAVIYTAVCLILKRITRYQYLRKRGSHGK